MPPTSTVAGFIVGPDCYKDDVFQRGNEAVDGTAVRLKEEISIKETYL